MEDIAKQHQMTIALSTLLMSDVGARIMGGMTKTEARDVLGAAGWSAEKIAAYEKGERLIMPVNEFRP